MMDTGVFKKAFAKATNDVKSEIQRMLKLDNNFSCQVVPITVASDDNTIYPSTGEVEGWLTEVFTKAIKHKPLSEKALEGMKKSGKTPGRPISDALVIITTSSSSSVVVGVFIPKTTKPSDGFCRNSMGDLECNIKTMPGTEKDDYLEYKLIDYPCEFPLKERDDIQRRFFAQLKAEKIYVEDDDSEEEFVNYLED